MSELTICNRCQLKLIRAKYPTAAVIPNPVDGFPDGVDIVAENGKELGWFAELPEVCVCG